EHVLAQLLRGRVHLPTAEPHLVRQAGMDANADIVTDGTVDGFAHDGWVASELAAGNVGGGDVGHHLLVTAHRPVAKTLTHVAVDVYRYHAWVQRRMIINLGYRSDAVGQVAVRSVCSAEKLTRRNIQIFHHENQL